MSGKSATAQGFEPVSVSRASSGAIPLPHFLAMLLVGLTPFWLSPAVNAGIFEVGALNAANVLPVVTFCLVGLTRPNLLRPPDRLGRVAVLLFFCYLVIFGVAFARSLPYLDRFSAIDPDVTNNVRAYIDSHLIVRSLMAMQFLYVLWMFRTEEKMQWLFAAISVSLFVLSCIVIVAVLSDPSVLATPLRAGMAKLTESILGIHYNGASAPYAIASPLLAFLAIKRGGVWTANYFLAFVAVLFLESRTALIIFVGMSVVTLVICGRARALFAGVPLVGLVAVSALGPIFLAILSQGFTANSGFSLFLFLSGRDQAIWLPLIMEWFGDATRFWFGAGEHGILTSDMLLTGRMLAVAVAHNAYLEFFLDNGIVGLLGLITALGLIVRWAWRTGFRVQSQLYWVLLLCFASFLELGFTGHRFFPDSDNMFVFALMAAMINVARLKRATNVGGRPAAGNAL